LVNYSFLLQKNSALKQINLTHHYNSVIDVNGNGNIS